MAIGIFSHFFAVETTLAERQFFRALAKLIGKRAARLSACGIASIVSKKGLLDEGCMVGADGSLYNVRDSIHYRRTTDADGAFVRCRNIPDLQTGYTRVSLISLAREDGT